MHKRGKFDSLFGLILIAGVVCFFWGQWLAGFVLVGIAAAYIWRSTAAKSAEKKQSVGLSANLFDAPPDAVSAANLVAPPRPAPETASSPSLPAVDNWETDWLIEHESLPVHVDLLIEYRDAKGQDSRRRITTRSVQPWDGSDYALLAFCHERGSHRTFLLSRIRSMVELESGEVISDPALYFSRRYAQSPEGKVAAAMAAFDDELVVVMYVARADGRLIKKERDLIVDYLCAHSAVALDPVILDREIRAFNPDHRAFAVALKALTSKPAEMRQAVVDLSRAIVAAEKKVDPMEAAAVDKLSAALLVD